MIFSEHLFFFPQTVEYSRADCSICEGELLLVLSQPQNLAVNVLHYVLKLNEVNLSLSDLLGK
jgi:hypothetical protein